MEIRYRWRAYESCGVGVVHNELGDGTRHASGDGVRGLTTSQRTGGWHGRQPVFFIVSQALMALCLSIRRWVIGTGGLGGFQL